MNRDEISDNMASPPTTEFRKKLSIDSNGESDSGSSGIKDRRRDNKMMPNKKMAPKASKPPISPLQSFMGDLMSKKKITSVVEDNARIASTLKQNFAINKAETRKGTERWDSASAFMADISPTPTLTTSMSSSFSSVALKSPPELPISPPTRAASTVDALMFPTSPLEFSESLPSDRSLRSRSPNRSSGAPRIPKRRQSTDLSLSPARLPDNALE